MVKVYFFIGFQATAVTIATIMQGHSFLKRSIIVKSREALNQLMEPPECKLLLIKANFAYSWTFLQALQGNVKCLHFSSPFVLSNILQSQLPWWLNENLKCLLITAVESHS